jgi:hypothetical protein
MFDATYQVCLTLKAISRLQYKSRVLAPWLTLAQFVAARPSLLESLKSWLKKSNRQSLELSSWGDLPRGYLTDATHGRIRSLLSARSIITERGDYVYQGPEWVIAASMLSEIETQKLFETEEAVLEQLSAYKVSKAMIGASP